MKEYIAIALLILCSCLAIAKKRPTDPDSGSCKAYFVVVEQDASTVNMQMAGFNTPQNKWYEKHGGEFPTLCVATTVSSRRELLNESTLINHLQGGIPVYVIGWEEHLMYNGAGNRYYEASGILYRLEDGKYVQLAPLHNSNHTILTSSSTSLLKEGLEEIKRREWKPQQSEEAKAEAPKTPSPSKPQPSRASRPEEDIVASLHSDKQDTLPLMTKTAYMIKRDGKYFIDDRLDGLLPNDVVLFSDSTCTVDPSLHAPGWDYVSVCRGQVWDKWLTKRPGDVYWIGWKKGEDYTTSVPYKGSGTTEKVSVTVDKTFDNTATEYAAVIDGWDTDNGALKQYTFFIICSKRFPDCHKLTAGATYSLTTVEDNDPAGYQPGAPTPTNTNGKQDKVLGSIRLTGDGQSVVYYIDSLKIKDQQDHVLDSVQVE